MFLNQENPEMDDFEEEEKLFLKENKNTKKNSNILKNVLPYNCVRKTHKE